MPFRDRSDAGRKLAKALAAYKRERPVILALARGRRRPCCCESCGGPGCAVAERTSLGGM
jgi:hypothetical protein